MVTSLEPAIAMVLTGAALICLLSVWVLATLWCAARYPTAPHRHASMGVLFTLLLLVRLLWPILRLPILSSLQTVGLPSGPLHAGVGFATAVLMTGVPAIAIGIIATQTKAPQRP